MTSFDSSIRVTDVAEPGEPEAGVRLPHDAGPAEQPRDNEDYDNEQSTDERTHGQES